MGLTASPERRTGNQNDQLGLAFEAIIDWADINSLIRENVLVTPVYKPYFIHDLNLKHTEIKNGDFPILNIIRKNGPKIGPKTAIK